MNRPELKKAYDFTVKGVIVKLTLLMAVLSVVRFLVDVYSLPLSALLANILKTYQLVFHTCVDLFLFWLPYRLPAWGKDLLVFYALFAFIYLRILYLQAEFNYKHPWIILHNFNNSRALFIFRNGALFMKEMLLWPANLPSLFAKPHLVVAYGAHGPSALSFSGERPIDGKWQGLYFGDARIMFVIRLLAIVLGSLVILLFNYGFSV